MKSYMITEHKSHPEALIRCPQAPGEPRPAALVSGVLGSRGVSLSVSLLTALLGLTTRNPAFGDDAKLGPDPWTAPARAARKQNPVASDASSIAQGKDLFLQACLPCHGALGKGDGSASALLERDGKPIKPGNLSDPKLWEQSDGAIFWKVSEGRTPMPAFQDSFSEEQRWRIVNYVRTLAPQPKATK